MSINGVGLVGGQTAQFDRDGGLYEPPPTYSRVIEVTAEQFTSNRTLFSVPVVRAWCIGDKAVAEVVHDDYRRQGLTNPSFVIGHAIKTGKTLRKSHPYPERGGPKHIRVPELVRIYEGEWMLTDVKTKEISVCSDKEFAKHYVSRS